MWGYLRRVDEVENMIEKSFEIFEDFDEITVRCFDDIIIALADVVDVYFGCFD